MDEMTSEYTVVFEREGPTWIVHVPEVPGCHTYGRNIDQARRRIREALALWVDDADQARLIEDVRLSAEARRALRRCLATRRRASTARAEALDEQQKAASVLVTSMGLGVRDVGQLLGLSHQRVQQLLRNP